MQISVLGLYYGNTQRHNHYQMHRKQSFGQVTCGLMSYIDLLWPPRIIEGPGMPSMYARPLAILTVTWRSKSVIQVKFERVVDLQSSG
jgi:hypothetical protein